MIQVDSYIINKIENEIRSIINTYPPSKDNIVKNNASYRKGKIGEKINEYALKIIKWSIWNKTYLDLDIQYNPNPGSPSENQAIDFLFIIDGCIFLYNETKNWDTWKNPISRQNYEEKILDRFHRYVDFIAPIKIVVISDKHVTNSIKKWCKQDHIYIISVPHFVDYTNYKKANIISDILSAEIEQIRDILIDYGIDKNDFHLPLIKSYQSMDRRDRALKMLELNVDYDIIMKFTNYSKSTLDTYKTKYVKKI